MINLFKHASCFFLTTILASQISHGQNKIVQEVSDLKHEKYFGKVKKVLIEGKEYNERLENTYDFKRRIDLKLTKEYNKSGNCSMVSIVKSNVDLTEVIENGLIPFQFVDLTRRIKNFGERCSYDVLRALEMLNTKLVYQYDDKNNLINIKYYDNYDENDEKKIGEDLFEYDNNGKLIQKNDERIKSEWDGNNLIKRNFYKNNGEIDYKYEISYKNNTIIIKKYTWQKEIITLLFNSKNQIISNSIEYEELDGFGNPIKPFQKRTLEQKKTYLFKYDNLNNIIEVSWVYKYIPIQNKINLSKFENYNIKIKRDKFGNIISSTNVWNQTNENGHIWKSTKNNGIDYYNEWEYKYDDKNNWIERIEYKVYDYNVKPREKVFVINRKIDYYQQNENNTTQSNIDNETLKNAVEKIEYFANGKIFRKAHYINGTLNGKCVNYTGEFGESVPKEEGGYVNGLKEGVWIVYEPIYANDGNALTGKYQVGRKEMYVNGKLNGLTYNYYQNGNVFEKQNYENDESHGEWVRYHENGKVRSKSYYENGIFIKEIIISNKP